MRGEGDRVYVGGGGIWEEVVDANVRGKAY